MKMPSVVGVRNLTSRVTNGDWAIVDGYDGVVILNPTESTLFRYGKIHFTAERGDPRGADGPATEAVSSFGEDRIAPTNRRGRCQDDARRRRGERDAGFSDGQSSI